MKRGTGSLAKVGDVMSSASRGQQPKASTIEGGTLIRFPDVHARTGLSRSTICRLEQQGQFPRHYRISPNAVAWLESEVAAWIRSRTDAV